MKKFVQNQLKRFARKIVEVNGPKVVAITGSVGKTSTRNAIATLLGDDFHVRVNRKNYNNEFGVPLTIIGMDSPGKSSVGWISVLWKAWKMSQKKDSNYPNMLVLEYGVDKPGDIEYLCEIAAPDIAVLTAISPVHLENFASMEDLVTEKGSIFDYLKEGGLAVVNADDEVVAGFKDRVSNAVSYGFSAHADICGKNPAQGVLEDFSFEPEETFSQVSAQVCVGGEEEVMVLQNRLGKVPILTVLAAVAVGKHLGLRLSEMKDKALKIEAESGRLRPIPGIKGALLLDDSYNAAPSSMRAALSVLADFQPVEGARRIAALGAMAELGPQTEEAHRMIGYRAAEGFVDLLVCVGEPALEIKRAAIEAGMDEARVLHFENAKEAGRRLDREIKKGDIVLIKGSQSTRMEHVVKDLMAEPLQAPLLLCRQYGKWIQEEI
jgi:UDP-N-acetylmuramyl pentapeptide synthase